ncbi:hypothetical protein Patl1_26034 [Pistacia atlantica]|uniref:Uncharacterized protein n=1 Tax=Pistacia atlantica TaxID=434234 RepID=A0ACC1B4U4_9ROSI|nr:hypothetical protein Patl1_26034 [Pistacia atlantica]
MGVPFNLLPVRAGFKVSCNVVKNSMLGSIDIDKEISELKMSVNTRGRLVATEFLKQFV